MVLIAVSGVFSATETAFSGLSMIRLKTLANSGHAGAAATLKLAGKYDKIITTVLIYNNIVNIAAASYGTLVFLSIFPLHGALISSVTLTVLILIFGEILPKTYAKSNAESLAIRLTPLLLFCMILLAPFIWLMTRLQIFVTKINADSKNRPSITEEELKVIIEEIKEEGVLESQESELARAALEFDETTAADILVPRVDVVSIEIGENIEVIKDLFLKERYSRLPVYKGSIDNVIGVLHQKDFFMHYLVGKPFTVKQILQKPFFVPPTIKISELLAEFKRLKPHMALVTDQHGGIDGIITLEDVLEELVGEIYDEDDEIADDFACIDQNTYRVSGNMRVDDVFEQLNCAYKDHEIEHLTISGWVLEIFEKIPEKGETFNYKNLTVTVDQVEELRILYVTIQLTVDS
ncbi:MAG: hemolysin family protein [Oscillospiraceae bacterium]|nr:hemolysin family protein [Oscillospiraceae bacterium]